MTTKHGNQSENTGKKTNCPETSGEQQGPIKSTYCCPSRL